MSFLAPLYFLGALAIAGPIIFHLIRRQPKGEVEFSSLMFLDSTPPRLTRRSRLENWPLLLLRCAAIALLALAFARPFLPLVESDSVQGVRQAIVLLIDQSASMKRTGLWEQATKKANEILDQTDDETLVSVIAFDSAPRTLVSLQESTGLIAQTRKSAAKDAIARLSPNWQATDTGKAIRYAADQAALLELPDTVAATQTPNNPNASASIETRIVLLSDLQAGAEIETLQGYQWPDRVWLDIETLAATTRGNVSLRVLPQSSGFDSSDSEKNASEENDTDTVRVQVTQTEDGNTSTFRLRFRDQQNDAAVVQVPPGQTRFFSVLLPSTVTDNNSADPTATLDISGDSDPFDNSFYFIRPKRIRQEIRFVESNLRGDGSSLPARETLSFYARQVPWSDASREVELRLVSYSDWSQDLDPRSTPLVIFATTNAIAEGTAMLQRYLGSGGRALVVLDHAIDESTRNALAEVFGTSTLTIDEAEDSDYSLISSVDFKSSLIAPLSDPGVNDFSNIRIWNHRVIGDLDEDAAILLKLDNGAPLLIQHDVVNQDAETPNGKLWLLATGWQPSESQFALSTKFVPILLGMLGPNRQLAPASLIVGDSIGEELLATEPGFVDTSDGQRVAVNLNPQESDTAAFDLDRISQYGAIVSSPETRQQEETAQRALRDVELEARQGWWQWLILATLGLIAAETLLAARDRQPPGVDA